MSYNYRYEYKKLNEVEKLESEDDILLNVFLRYEIPYGTEFTPYFEKVQVSYLNQNDGYIIGTISLSHIREITARKDTKTSVVLVENA